MLNCRGGSKGRNGLFSAGPPLCRLRRNPSEDRRRRLRGHPAHYPVSPYGYADKGSPILTRSPYKVIIGILGGSVAWSFHMHATDRLRTLLQENPEFAGKDLVFVNLAVSGYKQPQQLMTLNYMLVLGGQFDFIINIDGFNDVVLYEAENAARHVFPAFPRSWHVRVEISGPRLPDTGARLNISSNVVWIRHEVTRTSLEGFAALQSPLVDRRRSVGDQDPRDSG